MNDHWGFKDFAGGLIGGVIIAGLGVWMFMNPQGAEEISSGGRRGLWKMVLSLIWSDIGGVILILIGLAIAAATVHQIVKQSRG